MSNPLQALLSLVAAGCMMVSSSIEQVTPQNNPDDLLLVNRQWGISGHYQPELIITPVPGQVRQLRTEAAAALVEMFQACKQETGAQLVSVSGFRDYAKQKRIYDDKLKRVRGSVEKADEYVARPGTSEHQTGLTMDVGQRGKQKDTLEPSFGKSIGGVWLRENCWRFGFILRYEEGWEEITGYSYEPWHVRYVGLDHAAAIHEAHIPLEFYLQEVRLRRFLEILTPNLNQ